MLASVTRRRGYLYVPGLSDDYLHYGFVVSGEVSSSLFSHKQLDTHTLYLCKEGAVYVSGNSWLYRVIGDTPCWGAWASFSYVYTLTGVWVDPNGYPIEFEKVSRVELYSPRE